MREGHAERWCCARRAIELRQARIWCVMWLVAVGLLGCEFDRSPLRSGMSSPASTSETKEPGNTPRDAEQPTDTSDVVAEAGLPTTTGQARDAASPDRATEPMTGTPTLPSAPASQPRMSTPVDAGTPDAAPRVEPDASTSRPTDPPATPAPGCSRDTLRTRAEAYLQAMATGDRELLNLHPSARYTENGNTQVLGGGLWLSRPTTEFSRHVLDESRCSSVTEAVLNSLQGRIVFGVRLRYAQNQLLEIESQVVVRNLSYYDPDGVIPDGPDVWVESISVASRKPQDVLMQLAERYFDATADESLLPPHAPACERRQNGALMDDEGNCGVRPGTERFEQRRYPVIDEEAGIVTAIVMYKTFVGMYLFKIQNGTIQNIDVVGGANTSDPGW